MKLIVATYNNAKLREIKDILKGLNIRIVSLNYLEKKIKIKEDGKSYFENALKKAKTVSMFYPKDLIVGEDSGLEVYYLGKRPGIYSKRYTKNYNDYRNNLKIIKELEGVGCENRRARFFCCIALV
ncbi:MAG: non-canonical purine NTP pyrophosphatase, partial [Candidatus Aenigmatarchaeota archaeon]